MTGSAAHGQGDVVTSPSSIINKLSWAIPVIAVVVVLYWRTWADLGQRWLDVSDTYAHGLLIAGISGYLIWKETRRDRPAYGRLAIPIGVVVLAATLIWLVAAQTNILAVQSAMIPVVLLGSLGLIYGGDSLRRYLSPVLIIYFALPLWGFLTGILQDVTIAVVSYALAVLGITALIDGAYVHLPNGIFHIAAGCAGLNYFVASFAIAFICSYLWLPSLRARILFVIGVLIGAVALNWVRVTSLIVIGHATDMEHFLISVDHYAYGWILYFMLTLVTVFAAGRLGDRANAQVLERRTIDTGEADRSSSPAIRFLVVVALIAIAPMANEALNRIKSQYEAILELPPETLGSWNWSTALPVGWDVNFPGNSEHLFLRYTRQSDSLDVYMNVYARQSQGRELVSGQNFLFDPARYRVLERHTVAPPDDGTELVATQLHVESRIGDRAILQYWFQLGNARVSTEFAAKWEEIKRFGSTYPAGVVAVRMDCTANCDRESEILSRFVAQHGETLAQSIQAGADK